MSGARPARAYDRHRGGTAYPASYAGIGCVYDMIVLAAPGIVLLVTAGIFALVWVPRDPVRAALGAAVIALYGFAVVLPLYIPYIAGFVLVRGAARVMGVGRAAKYVTLLLAGVLALAALCFVSGHAIVAIGLLALIAVPALAGVFALGARALAARDERRLLMAPE